MVDVVEVKATYKNSNQVPRIGQSKRMRVNGSTQTLTLNRIEAKRRHCYTDEGEHRYEFDTIETWGGYYDVSGF